MFVREGGTMIQHSSLSKAIAQIHQVQAYRFTRTSQPPRLVSPIGCPMIAEATGNGTTLDRKDQFSTLGPTKLKSLTMTPWPRRNAKSTPNPIHFNQIHVLAFGKTTASRPHSQPSRKHVVPDGIAWNEFSCPSRRTGHSIQHA